MTKVYVLKKGKFRKGLNEVVGVYSTYKKAQDDFIYKDGLFWIEEFELDKYLDAQTRANVTEVKNGK